MSQQDNRPDFVSTQNPSEFNKPTWVYYDPENENISYTVFYQGPNEDDTKTPFVIVEYGDQDPKDGEIPEEHYYTRYVNPDTKKVFFKYTKIIKSPEQILQEKKDKALAELGDRGIDSLVTVDSLKAEINELRLTIAEFMEGSLPATTDSEEA